MKRYIPTLIKASILLAVLLLLTVSLVRATCFPHEINDYENRMAEKIIPLSFQNVMDGSFQDSVEAALGDQIFLSGTMKRLNNEGSSLSTIGILSAHSELYKDKYVPLGEHASYNGRIVYPPADTEESVKKFAEAAEKYNDLPEAIRDKLYVYYIERDDDVNFETGEKIRNYEYLRDGLNIDKSHIERFEINSFEDFSKNFFKSDHHWNCDGSYLAYTQILRLLGIDEEPVPQGEKFVVNEHFSGWKAMGVYTERIEEVFYAYRYEWPYAFSEQSGEEYGEQNKVLPYVSYGIYYGTDAPEFVFDTGNEDKYNVLVIGDSYDNAILKLLASNCNKLYSIDLRYYGGLTLTDYVRENEIDKILVIGYRESYMWNSDFFA